MKVNATTARIAITILVTAAIFWVTAGHIIQVAMDYGNDLQAALIYPAAIEGMITVSLLTLAANRAVSKGTRFWCFIGRYSGFAMALYANAAHSHWASIDAVLINAIPAISLIIMAEITVNAVKQTPQAKARTRAARKPVKLHSVA